MMVFNAASIRRKDTTVFDFRETGFWKRIKIAYRVIFKPHFQITHVEMEMPLGADTEVQWVLS